MLNCQHQGYKDGVEFSNAIMSDQMKKPGENIIDYKIIKLVKGPILHYLWHQCKRYLGASNGQCRKCQACSHYIQILDILLQLRNGASIDTRFVEYHILPFGRRSNVCRVWNSVSHSQINQQHRETKYRWLVNNILIWINKGLKLVTLWDNNWCHMHIHIEENHI